jgi:hypothetical protein
MGLENTGIVDAAGIDRDSGHIVLTIVDSWNWDDEIAHLKALQSKLNSYFDFVESGQVFESFPDAKTGVRINLISRYPLPQCGVSFLQEAAATALTMQISISREEYLGS